MTTTDERLTTANQADDLLLAAELVIASQQASAAMVQRKLRVGWDRTLAILDDLAAAGVVSGGGPGDRTVLVAPADLADTLARITADHQPVDPGPDGAVSLVKRHQAGGDEPGVDLVVRPDDTLAWPDDVEHNTAVQVLVVRARQAAARAVLVVADQPLVAKGLVVGHQLPTLAWRLVLYSPRGLGRTVTAYRNHLRDQQTLDLLAHYHETREGPEYEKVMKAREAKNLTARQWAHGALVALLVAVGLAWWAPVVFGGVLGVAVFVALVAALPNRGHVELATAAVAGGLTWWFGPDLAAYIPQPPTWAWWALLAVGVPVLGWVGWPKERPLVDMPAVMAPHTVPALTAPMVTEALCALGDSRMKDPSWIRLLMDVARHGQGYQIDLELPPGVTASDVIESREELAAALRREIGTVWPSVGPRHPGHLSLFVSDVPMSTAIQAAWPLAKGAQVSLFEPVPLFTDQRGQWVYQTLASTAWVIGAVPRMGKSRALLSLGLVAALDVRAKLYVFDLKGTGDLSSLAQVAHAYGVGDEPEDIEIMLRHMRAIRREMRERTRLIRDLTLEENPDKGKVTDQIATHNPRRFGPIVVLIDEVQIWTQEFGELLPNQVFEGKTPKDPGKVTRDEFIAILRDLVKRGPALGIIPIMATQKPDAKSIPSSIADNASARLCLKVNGQISNDQILGTSSYQAGIRATQFAFSDKGIAYFRGDGAEPLVVRTVFSIDAVKADELGARARALRVAAGLLTGEADDGIEDAVIVADIVDDVEQVMRTRDRGRAHHVELVVWLRELRPEDYESIDVEEVSARLRGRGIAISQIRIDGVNRKGVRLGDLREQADDDEG